jgi:hypothetical protein
MLTITSLIPYRTTTPLTRVKPAPKPIEVLKPVPKAAKPAADNAKRMRERRAKAREEGKCGTCATRWPRAGHKTCDACLK